MRRTDAQQGFSSAAADADVIVVGCGLAGLSAALAAAQRRARVVLFDSSSDLFATNDVADRLYFNAVDPERQGDLGITDSPELFYRQTLAAGGGARRSRARQDPLLSGLYCTQVARGLRRRIREQGPPDSGRRLSENLRRLRLQGGTSRDDERCSGCGRDGPAGTHLQGTRA